MTVSAPLVLFLQYTNPAGYPPLEHASRVLAEEGFEALFLGTGAYGAAALRFPEHPSISTRELPNFGGGLPQRLNYLCYIGWSLAVCLRRRPKWIYASDALSSPVAALASALFRVGVVYHEHDAPSRTAASRIQKLVLSARRKIARIADIVVIPQVERLREFVRETGRSGPTYCVWNCPTRDEVKPQREPAPREITFYYHGSINRERLPLSVVDALARAGGGARLVIVGYETIGSVGYIAELKERAAHNRIGDRVSYLGALAQRSDILKRAAEADVGLSFMPAASGDLNMTAMAGASNKPFDYMACGLMLLVSDLPDWKDMFVTPGYAKACNPADVNALADAMRWCVERPDEVRAMGEAGRRRIIDEWNYETCFAPVVAQMQAARA